jgi:mono/diheme cytochrome c family protein
MRASRLALAAGAVLAAIQLVPVERTNPPVESEVDAPAEVKAILRRACWDCHSHETVWPLQAYVAPVSWLVAHDVEEGREEMNFSRWSEVDPARVARKLPEEVGEGEMPPRLYALAHPGARLSDADRAVLVAWARGLARADARPRPARHED